MKNNHLFLLVILILASLSCQKDDESEGIHENHFTEQQLIGSWTGAFNQVGYGDFTGLVNITKLKVGEVTATGN